MKNLILLIAVWCIVTPNTYAQKSKINNNWIFGNNARLINNSGSLIAEEIKFYSLEACASVSDPNTGELLFYSNGVTVMDKNGNMLQNGDNLNGSETSSQGALILPHPTIDGQYLFFTTPAFTVNNSGLCYSVIDMNLNNGLGAIVPNKKNILLYRDVAESLTWTYNSDSSGYWIVTHERNTNAFLCLEVNKDGIGTQIIKSSTGRNWEGAGNYMARIKISPDYKWLAVSNSFNANSYLGQVELYDFDNCTGKVTNEIVIRNLPRICYDAAFAPNSNILYFTNLEYPSSLYQVNLASKNELDINNSLSTIYTAPLAPANQNRIRYLGGLQLYEDGKMYLTENGQEYLHCINNPNALGNNCSFEARKIILKKNTKSTYSLPQHVPEKLKPSKIILDSIFIAINDTCEEKIKKASLVGIDNPSSIKWKLTNLTTRDSSFLNNSKEFNFSNLQKGIYLIEVTVKQNCKSYFASKKFTVTNCECIGEIAISDTCIENIIKLEIVSKDAIQSTNWLVKDENNNVISKSDIFKINQKNDSILKINVRAIVQFECKTDTLFNTYNLAACPKCNYFFAPNVFTPNNDGLNDEFTFKTSCEIEILKTQIFNRWGGLVFESNVVDNYWNGTINSMPCPDGVYFYIIEYKLKGLSQVNKKGTITLVR